MANPDKSILLTGKEQVPTPTKGSNWILPSKLLVGQYPFPYSPIPVGQLRENITHIINLTCDSEIKRYRYPKSKFDGIVIKNYPIPDGGLVEKEIMLKIINKIHEWIQLEKSIVYTHCTAGYGRAGMVVACYLKQYNNFSGKQALDYVSYCYNTRQSKLHKGKKYGEKAPTISPKNPCQINFVMNF